jgi:general secretion pathway protein A
MTAQTQRLEGRLRSLFGLKTVPFAKDLEPDGLFLTSSHKQALEKLHYLVDRRGTGAVFGAPGTGKSTLLRAFLAGLGRTTHAVCYVTHTTCAILDLFREIARGFSLAPRHRKADVLCDLKERIAKLSRTQKVRPVLVLDEAHLLPAASLDELRLLTSFDQDSRDDLTLILSGHPQLESNLRLAVNEAIAQRIILRLRLKPLQASDVQDYLDFRLSKAGRTARLFLPDAVEAIARASKGIPRLIDRVAEQSMLLALAAKRHEIDAEIVAQAVDEVDP